MRIILMLLPILLFSFSIVGLSQADYNLQDPYSAHDERTLAVRDSLCAELLELAEKYRHRIPAASGAIYVLSGSIRSKQEYSLFQEMISWMIDRYPGQESIPEVVPRNRSPTKKN